MALLKPYKSYFDDRGLTLPPPPASDGLDYEQLVGVLMNPDTDNPKGLLDALYFVHKMSMSECMDILLQEADLKQILEDLSLTGRVQIE